MGWQDDLREAAQEAWAREHRTTTPVRRGSYRDHSRQFPEYSDYALKVNRRIASQNGFVAGFWAGLVVMLALVLILEGLGA